MPEVRIDGVRARTEHSRRLVRLWIEPRGGDGGPPRADVALRCVSGGQRPTSGVVPELAVDRPWDPWTAAVSGSGDPRLPDRHGRAKDVEIDWEHDRAAGRDQGQWGRNPAFVDRDERLHGRDPRQQGDPRAR